MLRDLLQKEEANRIDWTDIKNHSWFHPELNLEFDDIFEMEFVDDNSKSSSFLDSIASSFNSITNNISTHTSTDTKPSTSLNNSDTDTNSDFILIPTIEKIPPEKQVPNS